MPARPAPGRSRVCSRPCPTARTTSPRVRPEYERLRDEYGYAVCRLDLRGTGSSAGDAIDEYPAREQADLLIVIAWLAEQEWCYGNVGMYGTSYSGFNSLQIAAERPPALKAICAIYATDDRLTDDVHWRGGALKLVDLVDYCAYMTPMNALPPVPAVWGDGWREEWQRRVRDQRAVGAHLAGREASTGRTGGRFAPTRGYDRIECPVMLVAGWADGYRNNSFRTLEALGGPVCRTGCWPARGRTPTRRTAMPGPRIDLIAEMVAWWDRWLRGAATPASTRTCARLRAHVDRPRARPGAPRGLLDPRGVALPAGRTAGAGAVGAAPLRGRADVGTAAWIDCAGHLPWGLSGDQRHDDAHR